MKLVIGRWRFHCCIRCIIHSLFVCLFVRSLNFCVVFVCCWNCLFTHWNSLNISTKKLYSPTQIKCTCPTWFWYWHNFFFIKCLVIFVRELIFWFKMHDYVNILEYTVHLRLLNQNGSTDLMPKFWQNLSPD